VETSILQNYSEKASVSCLAQKDKNSLLGAGGKNTFS